MRCAAISNKEHSASFIRGALALRAPASCARGDRSLRARPLTVLPRSRLNVNDHRNVYEQRLLDVTGMCLCAPSAAPAAATTRRLCSFNTGRRITTESSVAIALGKEPHSSSAPQRHYMRRVAFYPGPLRSCSPDQCTMHAIHSMA